MTPAERDQALQRIADHGVVGAGGAGFPTDVKLKARAGTILLNAAECEPLMHKDKELLRHFAGPVLEGLRQAAEIVGAGEIIVGIKGKYAEVIANLEPKLPANGRIVALSDTYPSGDEFVLVYDATGKVIPPGGLPGDVGCVVINVETAYNIARGEPVTDTFLTVAGAVHRPITARVPIGISYGQALELAGGANVAEPRILSGGAMMGSLVAAAEPITKACGGMLVVPKDHYLARRYEQSWQEIARIGSSSCDQCSFCTEMCPRYLLGHPIEPHKAMRSLGFVEDREPTVLGTQFCCECNLCTMVACPEDLDPKSVCAHNKAELKVAGTRWKTEAHPYRADVNFADRRVPIRRLIHKLGLRDFVNEGPLLEASVLPDSVTLPMTQHVGAPARPVVSSGAEVKRGDLVAQPASGTLGATIHASIDGTCEVHDDRVVIRTLRPRRERQRGEN